MPAIEHNRWRPAYEIYAAFAWLIAAVFIFRTLSTHRLPPDFLWAACFIAVIAAVWRGLQAIDVWRHRLALEPRALRSILSSEVHAKMLARPDHVWLGWGFEWSRVHAQRLYDLEKSDLARLQVPFYWLWRVLVRRDFLAKGNPRLHGVQPVERDIYVPLSDLQGHVLVVGTTGAIKTRLLALMAVQAIRREPRETVIVIDPKGDAELRELLRKECISAGRGADFAFFHPAFPAESVRIDPLAIWTRTTEVASRIAALIPSQSGSDPWAAFGWRVLNTVVEGCVATHGARPTLTTIRRYVEGGIDELLRATLIQHLEREGIEWRTAIEPYMKNVTKYGRHASTTPNDTIALTAYYKAELQKPHSSGPLDGLISMSEHNREHFQKMLASLIPILSMLTAGELAGLLSPDRSDAHDPRPILSSASIVDSSAVVYVGLDALSDSVVASAIASIFLADLTAYAGARFNRGVTSPRISMFVDEAAESVNQPFIQLLNKGRGSGFLVTFFTQTVADFIARLGNESLARQVLANANSVIAGRIKDGATSEYVMEEFGRTILLGNQYQFSTNTVVGGQLFNYSGGYGERQTETVSEIVPQEAFGTLPDLEYFARYSGGSIVKARIPLVQPG